MTQSHQATAFFASRLALWRGLFDRLQEADQAIILPSADKAHWEAVVAQTWAMINAVEGEVLNADPVTFGDLIVKVEMLSEEGVTNEAHSDRLKRDAAALLPMAVGSVATFPVRAAA